MDNMDGSSSGITINDRTPENKKPEVTIQDTRLRQKKTAQRNRKKFRRLPITQNVHHTIENSNFIFGNSRPKTKHVLGIWLGPLTGRTVG